MSIFWVKEIDKKVTLSGETEFIGMVKTEGGVTGAFTSQSMDRSYIQSLVDHASIKMSTEMRIRTFLSSKSEKYNNYEHHYLKVKNNSVPCIPLSFDDFKQAFPEAQKGFYRYEFEKDNCLLYASICTTESGALATELTWDFKG